MHDIHYLRLYRELAVKDDNLYLPFRCSCGSVYRERLVTAFTKGHDGPEVLFWCMEENYTTPVGLGDILKAKKAVQAHNRKGLN